MSDVVVVNYSYGDLQAVYVNGKLFIESFAFDWRDCKDIIDEHGPIKSVTFRWLTTEAEDKYSDGVPVELSEYEENDFSGN